MRIRFNEEKDPNLYEFSRELCLTLRDLIKPGQGVKIAAKLGVDPVIVTYIRSGGKSGENRVRVDTVIEACAHIAEAPEVIVEAGGHYYDVTGRNFEPLFKFLCDWVTEMSDKGFSMYRLEAETGIRRAWLGQLLKGERPPFTLGKLLRCIEAIEGDVYISFNIPMTDHRTPITEVLSDSEDPYEAMIGAIRSTCVRNMMLMNLTMTRVAYFSEVDIETVEAFLSGNPAKVTFSMALEIAKACKCEINLTMK